MFFVTWKVTQDNCRRHIVLMNVGKTLLYRTKFIFNILNIFNFPQFFIVCNISLLQHKILVIKKCYCDVFLPTSYMLINLYMEVISPVTILYPLNTWNSYCAMVQVECTSQEAWLIPLYYCCTDFIMLIYPLKCYLKTSM